MPLYYFDIDNGDFTADDEGAELADTEAARAHAIKAARSLAADTVILGHLGLTRKIVILDENRTVIGTVTLAEAVTYEIKYRGPNRD